MNERLFVAREQELDRLNSFLDRALEGHGEVAFVTGEAGSGKTTLIHEFTHQAEEAHPELIVAIGNCNAQTGLGDPYLPFREVLSTLTSGIEAKAARAATGESASGLRRFLARSGQVLVELGPDLVDVLIPGSKLIGLFGKTIAEKAGWMDELEKLTQRKRERPALGESAVDQNRIFEQYTNVLNALAAEQPLILILDDLQWADAASISLLFHLVRRIDDSRILILGTYRPDEVALGRDGERHPLEKLVAECKRYFGDIVIDLGESEQSNGRQFVDALLDAEPNALGEVFRQALFQHTGGHPLFTVELLRTMKEQGDLVKDSEGRWVEGPSLDWEMLPARVEGVIEERIGRLEEEEREILNVASVEGQDFFAQVVARVQDMKERQVLQDLSRDLENRHRLVRELGEVRAGRQYLARYGFTQTIFQQYLYNELSGGERRLLHGEIARVLEELYSGDTSEITLQLAHHYAEAGDTDKAVDYLLEAGNMARQLYANEQAIDYFQRALAMCEEASAGKRAEVAAHIYDDMGDVLELSGQHEKARAAFESALAQIPKGDPVWLAKLHRKVGKTWEPQRGYDEALNAYATAEAALGDEPPDHSLGWWQEWVQLQLVRMWIYHWRGQWQEMNALVEKIRPAVEQYGTPPQRSKFFTALVLTAFGRDRYTVSDETLANAEVALTAIQEGGTPGEIALTQIVLGFSHLWRGELDEAEEHMQDALKLAERTKDITVQSRCLSYLTLVCRKRGAVEQTRQYCQRTMQVASAGQMLEDIGVARANLAWVAWREGNMQGAWEQGQGALELWRKLPLVYAFQWTALWPLIGVALAQGNTAEGVEYARALLEPKQQRLPNALMIAAEEAVKCHDEGQTDAAARTHLKQALDMAGELGYL